MLIMENILIDFINDFLLKNNRTPRDKDFKVSNGSPYSHTALENKYGSIPKMYEKLNMEQVFKGHKKHVNEDEVKKFINTFKEKNNRLPLSIEFTKKNGSKYCASTIKNKYGSLANCYDELGFDNNTYIREKEIDNDKLKEYIDLFLNLNGYLPGSRDFDRKNGSPYNKERIFDTFKSLDSMYIEFGFSLQDKTTEYNKQELLDNLKEAVYKYRTTDRDELRKLSPETIYDRSVYERQFKSFGNAMKLAGVKNENILLMAKFVDYNGEDPKKFIISKICSNNTLIFKQIELLNCNNISSSLIRKYFKSIYYYKILKDIPIENNIKQFSVKHEALDGHICDSNSEKIIDNFLYNNNISHEVHIHYPNSKKICDFKVKNKYIEYAGLYAISKNIVRERYEERMKNKIKFCQENNLELLILYDTSEKSLKELINFCR